ncbi:serine/threonine-protein kinase rio2 [Fagus crenata]
MFLDMEGFRSLSKDDFRVLTIVEMGMRNHEIVPSKLVHRIASLRHGGTSKVLGNLHLHKLLHHDSSKYDGFRLTDHGYDYLAIKALVNRGVFVSVGNKIGEGKESEIFEVAKEDGTVLAMKLHRLGRTSFRAVANQRDYLGHRTSYNWLYLSRLAATKEFAFMKALEEHGFPVPNVMDYNRHCVIMSLVQGYPLAQVKQMQNPEIVFERIIGLLVRLAEHGLIHCDYNEFNILIDDDEKVTIIDFPQMVSVDHRNAQMYFDRDVECIFKFFHKRFSLSFQESPDDIDGAEVDMDENGRPYFSSIAKGAGFLDKELAASGFARKQIEGGVEKDADSGEESEDGALSSELNESDISGVDSLHLGEQQTLNCDDEKGIVEENQQNSEAGQTNGLETQDVSDKEEDNQTMNSKDTELTKRLKNQNRRVIASMRGGRKSLASRNTYKDKGRRSSQNSKIQKQLSDW